MIGTPGIAVAIGGGYLLGRTKKLRFAIVIGGAVTGRRLPTSPTELFRVGAKVLAASPEWTRVSQAVRGRLLVAGRDAAIATVGYQIDVLTGRLAARLELLENPAAIARGVAGTASPSPAVEPAHEPGRAIPPNTVIVPADVLEVEDRSCAAGRNGHVIEGTPA